MKLKRFRVTNFRSIDDSGWIETGDVTALIGTNESGKTNVLLPLWKLNPAKEGLVVPTADYPRKRYTEIRQQKEKPDFVRAIFDVGDELAEELSSKTSLPVESLREVEVSRNFDNELKVDFPEAVTPNSVAAEIVLQVIDETDQQLQSLTALKTEVALKPQLQSLLGAARDSVGGFKDIGKSQLDGILKLLAGAAIDSAPKSSKIVPRYQKAIDDLDGLRDGITLRHPRDVDEAVDLVLDNIPTFVYYSTYGNLDSEIYLPHVIANLAREDLGLKEQAKARTLRVLFDFVQLQPKEIQELGRDFKEQGRQPTPDEIASIAEKKKQRSILLQSASTSLTTKFRDWWKQGEYRFRFEADGDHFRIWVSDDKRPEEVELEGRSTGLQWFLSFYLVFLVERADAHEDAILLLDEPGLSLHPMAQRDLSAFFDSLSKDNEILYTCHSPFLVDADRLDRARKVYVDTDGTSKVTADLGAAHGDVSQRGAAYAVHAALGLSVAESLLLGCTPVVVEGPSDQHYLTAIKNVLIAAGRLKPGREIVFPPAGGARGVKAIASILGGRDEELPVALFDSDAPGRETARALRSGLYVGAPDLVLNVETFTRTADSEIEDLIPTQLLIRELDRWQRMSYVPFKDEFHDGSVIVPQIKIWASKHSVTLDVPGWKVELAKRVKQRLLADGPSSIDADVLDLWEKLFNAFHDAKQSLPTDAAVGSTR